MKPIATAVLVGALCCADGLACAQSLEGTARSVMPPPGVSNFSGNKSGANTPIRNHANIYASVYADGTVPGPWIDDTSVRGKQKHRTW